MRRGPAGWLAAGPFCASCGSVPAGKDLVLDDVEDLGPEGFDAAYGFGGDGEDAVDAVCLFECGDGFGELVAAKAVGFGADDEVGAMHGLEGVDEEGVALLRGDVGVDETDAEGELFALADVGLDELGPLGGDGARDLGVAVAGEVGEDEGGAGVEFELGAFVEREEVDGACAAGGGGDFGFFGAEEGVDEGGFADVGSAEKGDFGGVEGAGDVRKVVGAHGGEQKFGDETHRLSLSLVGDVCV